VSIAELLQAGHAAVAGVAEKLQRTAKIKRSRIVPQMFLKLLRHFTVGRISSNASITYNHQEDSRTEFSKSHKHVYRGRSARVFVS
jgi:hypothetical protein